MTTSFWCREFSGPSCVGLRSVTWRWLRQWHEVQIRDVISSERRQGSGYTA